MNNISPLAQVLKELADRSDEVDRVQRLVRKQDGLCFGCHDLLDDDVVRVPMDLGWVVMHQDCADKMRDNLHE